MQNFRDLDNWSSSHVAKGGVFNLPKVNYSKETHEFITLLMREQKMSMMQRNKINSYLRSGQPLPLPRMKKTKTTNKIDYMNLKSAKRRTLSAIKASGDLDIEPYIPKKLESSDRKKILLQEHMSGLKHFPEENIQKRKLSATLEDQSDPTTELLREIQERLDWIEEMNKLGEGHKHREVIQSEIAERLRLINQYDSKFNCNN